MKRLLLTFAIILQGMTLAQSYAQLRIVNNTDGTEILKFKNIPIKGNIKDFDLKMRDENFIFIGNLYSTYNYIGMFYGRKSMLKFSMFLKQSKYPRWSLSFQK